MRRLIEKFITVHENDVAALALVKLFHEPRPRGAGNLACGNQEYMIQQNFAVGLGIENRMVDGHSRLFQDGRDILVSARAAGIDLVPLYLCAEVYPVACRQLVFHPKILAEFEGLLRMTAWADPVKSEALEQRDEHFFREFVLAGRVEEIGELFPLCQFFLRQGARLLREGGTAHAGSRAAQVAPT